ncbi:MAG: acyltransferase family protein [Clostridia bacterium]|nr:acyltransferase family protein [Clostridia bacterium]
MNVKQRNGKIDFYKFVFSVIIVLHHTRSLLGDSECLFLGGSFAVEFFFMVSGYLLMQSIRKLPADRIDPGAETRMLITRKVRSVFPEVFIAWLVGMAVTVVCKRGNPVHLLTDSLFENFLLGMTGLQIATVNGPVWYISSMLLCMAVLVPRCASFRPWR